MLAVAQVPGADSVSTNERIAARKRRLLSERGRAPDRPRGDRSLFSLPLGLPGPHQQQGPPEFAGNVDLGGRVCCFFHGLLGDLDHQM